MGSISIPGLTYLFFKIYWAQYNAQEKNAKKYIAGEKIEQLQD
jgi:hypothetical protein